MKRVCVIVALFLSPALSLSQIPNAGFESWANDGSGNVNPVGWETTNSTPIVTVDSVTPGHSGTYAMRVRTVNQGFLLPGAAILQAAISFTSQPSKFGAWVKSTIMPGDTVLLLIGLMKGDTVVAATDSCTFKITTSYATYTYLEFPIRYVSNKTPDSLYIMVATGLVGTITSGTQIIVDDIAFVSGPTSAEREKNLPGSFVLEQNYPNPFNPETVVSYQLSVVSRVTLAVYDLLGREVAVLVDEEMSAGTHTVKWNASGMSSGVYLVTMKAGSFVQTRKLVLIR